jgi:D-arabinose 1-dehydrogenase-like Zn-dependent alcohol dehydrogenase
MAIASRIAIEAQVETLPLTAANEALARLRAGRLQGAAVLETGNRGA